MCPQVLWAQIRVWAQKVEWEQRQRRQAMVVYRMRLSLFRRRFDFGGLFHQFPSEQQLTSHFRPLPTSTAASTHRQPPLQRRPLLPSLTRPTSPQQRRRALCRSAVSIADRKMTKLMREGSSCDASVPQCVNELSKGSTCT